MTKFQHVTVRLPDLFMAGYLLLYIFNFAIKKMHTKPIPGLDAKHTVQSGLF